MILQKYTIHAFPTLAFLVWSITINHGHHRVFISSYYAFATYKGIKSGQV